jgi:hypothetical protein
MSVTLRREQERKNLNPTLGSWQPDEITHAGDCRFSPKRGFDPLVLSVVEGLSMSGLEALEYVIELPDLDTKLVASTTAEAQAEKVGVSRVRWFFERLAEGQDLR